MDVLNLFLGFILIAFYLLLLGAAVANYVMTSIGYYTLAKRRLIGNAWLSWIPVAREWIVGKLADEYDERNGHERNWRITLLVTSLLTFALVVIVYIIIIASSLLASFGGFSEEDALALFMVVYIPMIFLILSASAYEVCSAICLFKIYESTNSKKAVKYIILSMIVPLAHGICLLKAKNGGYDYEPYTEPEVCEPDAGDASECECLPCENECEDSTPALDEVPEVTDSEIVEE